MTTNIEADRANVHKAQMALNQSDLEIRLAMARLVRNECDLSELAINLVYGETEWPELDNIKQQILFKLISLGERVEELINQRPSK